MLGQQQNCAGGEVAARFHFIAMSPSWNAPGGFRQQIELTDPMIRIPRN